MKKIVILSILSSVYFINSIVDPTGIQDKYKNSYINSVLQSLQNINSMTNFILKSEDLYYADSLANSYFNFLKIYKESQKAITHNVDPENFLEKVYNLKSKDQNIFIKDRLEDPYIFLNKFLEHLIDKDVLKEKKKYYSYPFKDKVKNKISDIFYSVIENLKENKLKLVKTINLDKNSLAEYFSDKKLVRFPKILIIKLNKSIKDLNNLSLNNLDLNLYKSEFASQDQQYIYDLNSAIFYKQDLSSGHYTAYVKVEENWYFCNDSTITRLNKSIKDYKDLDQVRSPYILFYKQRPKLAEKEINAKDILAKLIALGFKQEDILNYLKSNNIKLQDLSNSINNNLINFNFIKKEINKGENLNSLIIRLMNLRSNLILLNLRLNDEKNI